MSQTFAMTSRLNYRSILDNALVAYQKKTGKDLRFLPLLSKLRTSNSPDEIITTLREQISGSGQISSSDKTFTKWLDPIVNVLFAFSATVVAGVSLTYPPAAVIFSAIGVLLSTVKAVRATEAALVSLFERIESFFRRLEAYIAVPSIAGMKDTMVRIMVEVLSVLAIVTKEIKQNRATTFLKKLAGRSDIEDALQRLDKLTQEESWMAAAQGLKATHRVEERVADGVEKITQQLTDEFKDLSRNQLRERIAAWLSPPDPSLNFNIASDARHKGTATWFTQVGAFNDWKASGSFLLIHGKPGSGKSVLTSAIIQHIKSASDTRSAHMAYFFFDFKDTGKQDARALLSSVLVQLSNQSDPLCDILLTLYSTHHRGSQQPSNSELTQCLVEMLGVPGQVPIYIVIDALDECPITTGTLSPRRKVLALIEKLVNLNLPNFRLCVTSRPEIDIRISLESLKRNSMSLHDERGQKNDIIDFIRTEVYSDINIKWRDDDKTSVIETLSERADGMFRWVVCQLEILRHCLPSSVRHILTELPNTLDETYERILREIPKANRGYAHRLLQCLTVAARPLKLDELAEVLAIDFSGAGGIPQLREELRWENQEQAVLSACSSLIMVVDTWNSRIVQFSHFSVKEFLTSGRLSTKVDTLRYHDIRPEAAHTIMAKACLCVLLRFDYTVNITSIRTFPLAVYAADNFGYHAQFESVLSQVQDGIDDLLDAEKPHYAAWLWITLHHHAIDYPDRHIYIKDPKIPEVSPLYSMAEFGFHGMVKHLIMTRPQDLNVCAGSLGTPLHGAVYAKQVAVLQLLLGYCEDVDVRDSKGRTPLHLAADLRSLEIIGMLVEYGADINARDENGRTPLHEILHSLLSYMSPDIDLYPVQFLLQHGADVDAGDNAHSTPLHMASHKGYPEAVRILLEHGANVHARNSQGQTPLCLSMKMRTFIRDKSFDIARLLLAHGASIGTQDNDNTTPLHVASSEGRLKAVQILLDHGANVHARNKHGQTPLHRSLKKLGPLTFMDEYLDVIRILLAHGADVDARDIDYSTPLHIASYYGSLQGVQILLNHGANVNARNNQGQTPLHRPRKTFGLGRFRDGDLDYIRILLSHGAVVDVLDNNHSTPLHMASYEGCFEIVEILLEHGADVHARNEQGQTPLHQFLRNPDYAYHRRWGRDVLDILLRHGADVNAQDNDYSTPLHIASSQGCSRSVGTLLVRGASVHARNNQYQTPLHQSLKNSDYVYHPGYSDVIRCLVMHGADVNAQDVSGATPLHLASFQGSRKHTQQLLEHGADVQMENEMGETPSQVASARGHQEVMWLLSEHERERGA